MAAPAPGEEGLEDALEDLDDDLAVRAARAAVENSDDELLEVPARRRKRRVVRRWDPLSPAQVNNLATRFEKHHAERAALQELIDTHPHDGMVSLVEWKRFCKLVEQSGLSFYDFVKCYAIGAY